MLTQRVEVETQETREDLANEFLRHVLEGAKRQKMTAARYLLEPANRENLGISLSEEFRQGLIVRSSESDTTIPTAGIRLRYLPGKAVSYLGEPSQGEVGQLRERVQTGWEINSGRQRTVPPSDSNWEVGMERIRISVPKMVEDRKVPDSERGSREISRQEIARATGLTENQFEIQPILGRSRAVCEGILEAVPVILPRIQVEQTSDDPFSVLNGYFVRDPMLLRVNLRKMASRLSQSGDIAGELAAQVNGISSQAVHYAVQALAEANMASYLAAHLSGEKVQVQVFMKERMKLLAAAAKLAMTAYESLVNQAIAFSQIGIQILTPREFGFAAEATGSFFDGMSEAGQFAAGGTGRLNGVVNQLENDLLSLRGRKR